MKKAIAKEVRMRNEINTPFWKNALESLPPSLRARYAHDIAAAERWELRIDAALKGLKRARTAFTKSLQTA
jgi:ribosomal protein L31E